MRVPVKIVVDRMIDTLFVFAAVSEVEGGNAEMIEKAGEVGARAEGRDAQVSALAQLFLVVGGLGVGDSAKAAAAAIRVIFVSGSSISRATPLMNFSSLCEPPMLRTPRSLPSVLI